MFGKLFRLQYRTLGSWNTLMSRDFDNRWRKGIQWPHTYIAFGDMFSAIRCWTTGHCQEVQGILLIRMTINWLLWLAITPGSPLYQYEVASIKSRFNSSGVYRLPRRSPDGL